MKRVLSMIVVTCLLLSILPTNVFASYRAPVSVTMEAPVFNITLPTSLPVSVSADGTVTTANDVKVINNSTGPIKITDISIKGLNGYDIAKYGDSLVGTVNKISMKINNMDSPINGGSLGLTSAIKLLSKEELPITYLSMLSFHNKASTVSPASVVFTAGFDIPPPVVITPDGTVKIIGEYEYGYKQEVNPNTYTFQESNAVHDGAYMHGYGVKLVNPTIAPTTEPVHSIDGVPVLSYYGLFSKLTFDTLDFTGWDTSNIIRMMAMFDGCRVKTIKGLTSFDTSKLTYTSAMFRECTATEIDVSSFDTSNVENMANMFKSTSVTVLDLSSFDMSKVNNQIDMFKYCKATTGYARTAFDAKRFNDSAGKPDTLTFIVKP